MLYKQIYEVPFNRQIIINIPENIGKNKKILIIIDEIEDKKSERLKLSDFSFYKTRKLLKDYNGSFSDTVIEERRKSL